MRHRAASFGKGKRNGQLRLGDFVDFSMETELRRTMEFVSTGYYRFSGNALTSSPCASTRRQRSAPGWVMPAWACCSRKRRKTGLNAVNRKPISCNVYHDISRKSKTTG